MRSASQNIPLRIVSIGGGNGLSTLLRGLKRYVKAGEGMLDITAVVTVTDDGGSSGRLRRDFDVLPPGDIRNCMVALSEDETLLRRLFQYPFLERPRTEGPQLRQPVSDRDDAPDRGFRPGRAIFGGSAGGAGAHLSFDRGQRGARSDARQWQAKSQGETRISRSRSRIEKIEIHPRRPKPLPETLEAIANADLITLGPGSLFTSVIPNLLVDGIPQAIAAVAGAEGVFREPDVAAGRDHEFSRVRSRGGHSSAREAADSGRLRGQYARRFAARCWIVTRQARRGRSKTIWKIWSAWA